MNNKLTIVQNFIVNESKLAHLKSDKGLKATANVLGDCRFIVNYKLDNFGELFELYNQYIPHLDMFNFREDEQFTWAKSTLKLVNMVTTPYVFYLTEDRMFHKTTKEEFNLVIDEVNEENIGFMCIGKLHKYSGSVHPEISKIKGVPQYIDNNKHIYTYLAKNSPYTVLSIDSIFRTDILKESLNRIIHKKSKVPHILEQEQNWLINGKPDLLCAVPKNGIIVSDDDPPHLR